MKTLDLWLPYFKSLKEKNNPLASEEWLNG